MCRLDSLPPEILLEILDYNALAHNRRPTPIHPLNAIASTNKHLYAVVEEYARGNLKQYTNFTPPKNSRTFCCRKKWLGETCQFCKRKSQKRAIFYVALTCCRLCDKQKFAKMTMTQAAQDHSLSKLDLFTPNELHPTLPPLTTGVYTVMGSPCTMILESDVLARKAYITSMLGDAAETFMQRRPATHDRIIAHMGLYYCCGNGTRPGRWRKAPPLNEVAVEKAAKSMRSEEGRRWYVRKGLEREWEALGVRMGRSEEDALEIED